MKKDYCVKTKSFNSIKSCPNPGFALKVESDRFSLIYAKVNQIVNDHRQVEIWKRHGRFLVRQCYGLRG